MNNHQWNILKRIEEITIYGTVWKGMKNLQKTSAIYASVKLEI